VLKRNSVALAHHWLLSMRGGEKVLEQLCQLFPDAPVYTLFCRPNELAESIRRHSLIPSFLNRIPGAASIHQQLLPLFPVATRCLSVSGDCELVISSDASVIKGLHVPENTTHVCYCHSPPRYAWDMMDVYEKGLSPIRRAVFRAVVPAIRRFDLQAASRVDHFIANSNFVADRIRRFYGRPSEVICPPAEVEMFEPARSREDFYLIVAQLVSYKRVDLAVDAFTRMGRKLVVIGEGSQMRHLRSLAGPTIQLLGKQPFAVVKEHFEKCRAFVFPGVEDFGITAVEAQAAGAPVIAIGMGGALETVVEGQTGVFFHEQTTESLIDAVQRFERTTREYGSELCRQNSRRFSNDRFRSEMMSFLSRVT